MIWLALALAASQPAQAPRQFIAELYARYQRADFSPLGRPEAFFSRDLAAAIRKDGSAGEVGYLDGDPLCDCQDYDHIRAEVRSLTQPGTRAAMAKVHVILGPREARDIRLRLILTGSGWRISDVIGADNKSLLQELRRSNARRWPQRRSPRQRT